MAITVSSRQFDVTPDVRDFAVNRLSLANDDPVLKVASVNVVVRQEKNRFMVTVVLNCKYHVITAKTEDFDVIKAIDTAADKIDSQCKNLRERIIEHRAEPLSESERKAAEAEALAE